MATGCGSDAPIDPTAVAAMGAIMWRLDASIQAGWVQMNARTIGGAGSGATELANVSKRALFLYSRNTFPDSIASVVGGHGVSASKDFSSGRQITSPMHLLYVPVQLRMVKPGQGTTRGRSPRKALR